MNSNRKTGLFLFLAYSVCYAVFVLVNAFAPSAMEQELGSGINVAIASGFGLIGLALVFAVVYGWLCRSSSKKPSVGGLAAAEMNERS